VTSSRLKTSARALYKSRQVSLKQELSTPPLACPEMLVKVNRMEFMK